ncbi:MAG: BNR-4 repeat-containing protein [bacterium]
MIQFWTNGYSQDKNFSKILEGEFDVHPANRALFNSAIASFNSNIYVAFINPNLKTVVAKKNNGVWTSSIVATITQPDTWHNAPSMAVDSEGYIHMVYNMHSTPWQYSVSKYPKDISEWEFRGQYAGTNPGKGVPTRSGCEGDCKKNWMGEGIADIPGNQITYSFIVPDRKGILYISYRECYNCRKSDYFSREWSGGIAKYDVITKSWQRVGGVRPFAHDEKYVPASGGMYMFFDINNRMHVSWVWGQHYTAKNGSKSSFYNPNFPTYAYSDDGGENFYRVDGTHLNLPINLEQSDVIIDPNWINPNDDGYFYSYTNVAAMPDGTPYVFIWPRTTSSGVNRAWLKYVPDSGWTEPALMPWAATKLLIDSQGVMTAISSGTRVHRSKDGGRTWRTYEIDLSDGPQIPVPDYSYFYATDNIRFLTTSNRSSNNLIKIWTIEFSDNEE